MRTSPTPSANRTARRGAVAFETLLFLPLFTLVMFGAVGIADLILAEQRLDEACGRAARCAAVGGSPEQVRACVVAVLGHERGKHAKIYVGPVGKSGRIGHDEREDDHNSRDDRDDRDNRNDRDEPRHVRLSKPEHGSHGDDGIEWHPVRCGELLEVRIELDAHVATSTKLARICGSKSLLTRTVMQRE